MPVRRSMYAVIPLASPFTELSGVRSRLMCFSSKVPSLTQKSVIFMRVLVMKGWRESDDGRFNRAMTASAKPMNEIT